MTNYILHYIILQLHLEFYSLIVLLSSTSNSTTNAEYEPAD